MASEPYWAAAPSRNTSTRSNAIAGIVAKSGPCAPRLAPSVKVMTEARWRRLPLTSTSVESADSPRRLAGRTSVAASLMGCWLTL